MVLLRGIKVTINNRCENNSKHKFQRGYGQGSLLSDLGII